MGLAHGKIPVVIKDKLLRPILGGCGGTLLAVGGRVENFLPLMAFFSAMDAVPWSCMSWQALVSFSVSWESSSSRDDQRELPS